MVDSNDMGRALELSLVKSLAKHATTKGLQVRFSKNALQAELRDRDKIRALTVKDIDDFTKFNTAFIKWTESNGWFEGSDKLEIDRSSDAEGIKGSVTDIFLTFSNKGDLISEQEISLKNHHDALKHPRPSNLPDQCGIFDKRINEKYRERLNEIWQEFYKNAKKLVPIATKFQELKKKDKTFVDKQLYGPILTHMGSFLSETVNNPRNAATFFTFLVGGNDYYVVKNEQTQVIIKHFDFSEIKRPTSFKITYPFNETATTFLLEFDNGWKITARLHTASSEFYRNGKINSSVKLDVQCINLDDLIKIDRVSK